MTTSVKDVESYLKILKKWQLEDKDCGDTIYLNYLEKRIEAYEKLIELNNDNLVNKFFEITRLNRYKINSNKSDLEIINLIKENLE